MAFSPTKLSKCTAASRCHEPNNSRYATIDFQRGAARAFALRLGFSFFFNLLMAKGSGSCTLLQLSLVLLLEQPWLDLEEEPANLMDAALTTPLPYHLRIDNTVVN